jgi:hypothetical protein
LVDGCSVFGSFTKIVLRNSLPWHPVNGDLRVSAGLERLPSSPWSSSDRATSSSSRSARIPSFKQNATDWGSVMACSVIMPLPPAIIFAVLNKYLSVGGIGGSLALHPHVGTWIETEQEMESVLAAVPNTALRFRPDTGHLTWAGMDAVAGWADMPTGLPPSTSKTYGSTRQRPQRPPMPTTAARPEGPTTYGPNRAAGMLIWPPPSPHCHPTSPAG